MICCARSSFVCSDDWPLTRATGTRGLWLGFIGWYLLTAAQQSIAQIPIRDALSGLHASDVMSHEVPTIDGHITLEEYGAEVLRTGRRCHLVLSGDRLVGMMNVHILNAVPRPEWEKSGQVSGSGPLDSSAGGRKISSSTYGKSTRSMRWLIMKWNPMIRIVPCPIRPAKPSRRSFATLAPASPNCDKTMRKSIHPLAASPSLPAGG